METSSKKNIVLPRQSIIITESSLRNLLQMLACQATYGDLISLLKEFTVILCEKTMMQKPSFHDINKSICSVLELFVLYQISYRN